MATDRKEKRYGFVEERFALDTHYDMRSYVERGTLHPAVDYSEGRLNDLLEAQIVKGTRGEEAAMAVKNQLRQESDQLIAAENLPTDEDSEVSMDTRPNN